MMRIIVIALSVVVVLIVAVLAVAASKPNVMRVRRSIVIEAQPAAVFALISDFHQWPRWAPQDREDATMRRSYSGAPHGPEAISEWTSSGSAGVGRMSITAADAPSRVVVTTDFKRPFVAHNVNEFELVDRGTSTEVTWTMSGTNPFIAKVMSVFVNMDTMMGSHFERGLSNLKKAAEAN
jgi:uncharacterized protein YndB with AHSA1/START domain